MVKLPSFEIIGSKEKAIAIVELRDKLNKKQELEIAKEIIKKNKHVKTVLKKESERLGKYRLRKLKLLYGDKNTEVVHKEYGYLLKLDPRKVYFSARESTERQRIACLVKKDENVLVMFSGICPIAIAIAKKQPSAKIYAIELNKVAHKYALENIRLNKRNNIVAINGDVKRVIPKLKEKFDRIVMPLPKEANLYLDLAIKYIKPKGIIVFYSFSNEQDLFKKTIGHIKTESNKLNRKIKIISKRVVLPYGPRKWKVAIEFSIK